MGSAFIDFKNISVSALLESLAQIPRLVDSELKFCKQSLKYGRHNSFYTFKFEMSENKVQMYKPTSSSSLWMFYMFIRFSIAK